MSQKSLFETSNYDGERSFKVARDSDPETSHKAAANVNLSGRQKLFFDTLKKMPGIPRTAKEVAAKAIPIDGSKPLEKLFSARETLRKAAKELVVGDKIRECQSRECKISGNEATTYEVVK